MRDPGNEVAVSLSIVYEIAIYATDFVNNTSALQGRWFVELAF